MLKRAAARPPFLLAPATNQDSGADLLPRAGTLEHNPEEWVPVLPRDKREAFARRSCSNKMIERDDDPKKVIKL
jgi:hypothetical protein